MWHYSTVINIMTELMLCAHFNKDHKKGNSLYCSSHATTKKYQILSFANLQIMNYNGMKVSFSVCDFSLTRYVQDLISCEMKMYFPFWNGMLFLKQFTAAPTTGVVKKPRRYRAGTVALREKFESIRRAQSC